MEKSGIKLTLKKSKVVQKLSPDEVDGSSPLSAAPASPPHAVSKSTKGKAQTSRKTSKRNDSTDDGEIGDVVVVPTRRPSARIASKGRRRIVDDEDEEVDREDEDFVDAGAEEIAEEEVLPNKPSDKGKGKLDLAKRVESKSSRPNAIIKLRAPIDRSSQSTSSKSSKSATATDKPVRKINKTRKAIDYSTDEDDEPVEPVAESDDEHVEVEEGGKGKRNSAAKPRRRTADKEDDAPRGSAGEKRKRTVSTPPPPETTASPKAVEEDPPPPKKTKLPTIQKKSRMAGSLDSPSTSTPKTIGTPSSPAGKSALPPRPRVPKPSAGDVDLNDEEEYAKLMGLKKPTVPAAAPARPLPPKSPAGPSVYKSAEDKKRDLDIARENARIVRLAEWNPKGCFDMDQQSNKMKDFERKLRALGRESFPNRMLSAWQRRDFFKAEAERVAAAAIAIEAAAQAQGPAGMIIH